MVTVKLGLPIKTSRKMSSRKKEKIASRLDHKQDLYYPLDYSFKTLSVFEGTVILSLFSLYQNLQWLGAIHADILMEKPRSREHQAVVNEYYCDYRASSLLPRPLLLAFWRGWWGPA